MNGRHCCLGGRGLGEGLPACAFALLRSMWTLPVAAWRRSSRAAVVIDSFGLPPNCAHWLNASRSSVVNVTTSRTSLSLAYAMPLTLCGGMAGTQRRSSITGLTNLYNLRTVKA